jgi:hypothetical protein
MRTENDLRIALQHRADDAPEPSIGLLEHARTAKPRSAARPALTIGLAVAVVAALIAVPFAVIGHRTHSSNPPISHLQKPTDPLSWVSIDPSLDYEQDAQVGTNKELVQVYLPGTGVADLSDFAPGRFDPALITHRIPATVDGHAGYFGRYLPFPPIPSTPGESATDRAKELALTPPLPALAWPVATDQWAVLYPSAPELKWDEAKLQSIASTLKVGPRTVPLRLPFKLTYLPAGWSLASTEVGNMDSRGLRLRASIGILNGTHHVPVTLSMDPPDSNLPYILHRKVGNYWFELDPTQGPFDTKTAQRILDSAVVATQLTRDVNDSWFPISSIVP